MSKNAMSYGRRYNDDGFFTKYGRGDRGGRRLEFTTHDGLGHAVSRVCSRRGAWAEALAMRATKLAKVEAERGSPWWVEAMIWAGMTKPTPATEDIEFDEVEVDPTQCPKSPETISTVWLLHKMGVGIRSRS